MNAVLNSELGNMIYTEDFIASLAGIAATECYGVVGMASQQKMADGFSELLGRDNLKKGVKIMVNEDHSLKIDLFIIVQYGISVIASASSIQNTVKYKVESTTGLVINEINVNVSGIRVTK